MKSNKEINVICPCGEIIKNPSYVSNSKYDYMCNSCKGYEDEYELPITGEQLFNVALDEYNKQELLGDENG